MEKITTLKQLKQLASQEDGVDCFIALNGGIRSSKQIIYTKGLRKPWYILNFIDDSTQELREDEIKDPTLTNIYEAIIKGALYTNN